MAVGSRRPASSATETGRPAAEGGGAGAAFVGVGLVEEGVGHGVEEFVGEDWLGTGVSIGETADGSARDAAEDLFEPSISMASVRTSLHDLVDEWMIRGSGCRQRWSRSRRRPGEDVGEKVFRAGALDLRGDALALGVADELEGAGGGPTPAVFEDGRGDGGLFEEFLGGVLGEELEDVGEGEGVLLGEGDVDAVVGGGGLELEVEATAEALAEGEAPGLVDAAAEGGVEDELHASRHRRRSARR